MTSILIVVLNWNGIDDTEVCVASLLKQSYKNYQILIIDNGSVDDSVSRIKNIVKQNPKKITFLQNKVNLGFAGGVNTGIKYAIKQGFDAVALFNNDATADVNWLASLEKNLHGSTRIVTGLLLHDDNKTIDSTGDFYSTWGIAFPRNRNQPIKKAPASGLVFSGSGGASLYSLSLFKEIGFFDETFFAYYEDIDISFRTQLAGYCVFYTKDAIAYHKQGATSKKIPGFTVQHTFKNLPLLFWKNVPTKLLIPVGSRFILLYTLILANAIKNGSGWHALKGFGASIWFFWTKSLWQRLSIQKNKKVTSKYIWQQLYHDIPPDQTGMRKFRAFFTNTKKGL